MVLDELADRYSKSTLWVSKKGLAICSSLSIEILYSKLSVWPLLWLTKGSAKIPFLNRSRPLASGTVRDLACCSNELRVVVYSITPRRSSIALISRIL